MHLILSTGSNLGNRTGHLLKAKDKLSEFLNLLEESRVYESPAVDYLNQPDFLNQVLLFEKPSLSPSETITKILSLEKELGRVRDINKGPRTVDIDILFWGHDKIDSEALQVPHPRLFERSFIVEPLRELSVFAALSNVFKFQEKFDNECWVYKP